MNSPTPSTHQVGESKNFKDFQIRHATMSLMMILYPAPLKTGSTS